MEEKSYKRADFWSGLVLAVLAVFIVITARKWQFMMRTILVDVGIKPLR